MENDQKKFLVVLETKAGLSTAITYGIEQVARDALTAAMIVGQRVATFPEQYPLPPGAERFTVAFVTEA